MTRPPSAAPVAVVPLADADAVDGDRVLARVGWRLIPFLFLLYVLNYLDRINVSFAGDELGRDLGFTDTIYGFGVGIFFLGYALFEVPSNLILERVGARRWIARIMVTWGIVATAMMFVRGPVSFSVLRAMLGVAEAGFFPGIILYLTYWFPPAQRARAFGLFLTSTALSGVFGSPLSAMILRLDGVWGLRGWQWLFMLEGLPCIPIGLFVLYYLPDRPRDARWLRPAEAAWLEDQLKDAPHAAHHDRAIINSLGCTSGFFAPLAIGYMKDKTGGYSGVYLVSGALVVGAGIVLSLPRVEGEAE